MDEGWSDALAAAKAVHIPAGTWQASTLTLPTGKSLLTAGLATVIEQKSGLDAGTHIIDVTGSKTRVAPSGITLRGNIATDTGEQCHGIVVRGTVGIFNIQIGNVRCENIRGDGVYVGGTSSAPITDVTIGDVTVDNVYRSGISITGGERITVGAVSGERVGFRMFNIEPASGSQVVHDVTVQSITGHCAQIAGQSAELLVERVDIGSLNLDAQTTGNSDPAYSLHDVDTGLVLRNLNDLDVGSYRARNFEEHAIEYVYSGGEILGDGFIFGSVDFANCNFNESTYNAQMQIINCENVTLSAGSIVLPVGVGKVLAPPSETLVLDDAGVQVSTA